MKPFLSPEEDLFAETRTLRSESSSQIIPYNNRAQFFKIHRILTLIDKNMTLVRYYVKPSVCLCHPNFINYYLFINTVTLDAGDDSYWISHSLGTFR